MRDVLLGATPKDFDVLTTAAPAALRRLFPRVLVVGSRFPVTHVRGVKGRVHEVSTLSVTGWSGGGSADGAGGNGTGGPGGVRAGPPPGRPQPAALAAALASDMASRDFTVNALAYDPASGAVLDVTGRGLPDVTARRLRTVGNPATMCEEDPARVLRAVRMAARAGLRPGAAEWRAVTGPGAAAAVASLPDGRLANEVHQLLAHGAATPSLVLLWKAGLLDVVLPALGELVARQAAAGATAGNAASAAATAASNRTPSAASRRTPSATSRRSRLPSLPPAIPGKRAGPLALPGAAAVAALDAGSSPARPAPKSVWVAALAVPLIADAAATGLWPPKIRPGRPPGGLKGMRPATDDPFAELAMRATHAVGGLSLDGQGPVVGGRLECTVAARLLLAAAREGAGDGGLVEAWGRRGGEAGPAAGQRLGGGRFQGVGAGLADIAAALRVVADTG